MFFHFILQHKLLVYMLMLLHNALKLFFYIESYSLKRLINYASRSFSYREKLLSNWREHNLDHFRFKQVLAVSLRTSLYSIHRLSSASEDILRARKNFKYHFYSSAAMVSKPYINRLWDHKQQVNRECECWFFFLQFSRFCRAKWPKRC